MIWVVWRTMFLRDDHVDIPIAVLETEEDAHQWIVDHNNDYYIVTGPHKFGEWLK